jgi:Protein of unknown function (DUF732)
MPMLRDRSGFCRPPITSVVRASVACAAVAAAAALAPAPSAHADVVAYLVNVHVRPGYNFPNGDAALGYGYSICDKVAGGRPYAQVMDEVKADFATSDEYQASHLINQAVNELCPAQIWQLRNSAAHYRPPLAPG